MAPRILAAATAALLMVTLSACGGSDPEPAADDEHAHHGSDGSTVETGEFEVVVGGAVSLSGDYEAIAYEVTYTVTSVGRADTDDDGTEPAEHDIFVVAEVQVHGFRGDHDLGVANPDYTFSILDADGTEYPQSEQVISPALSGTVTADQTLTGNIVFDVPESVLAGGKVRLLALGANGSDLTIDWKY